MVREALANLVLKLYIPHSSDRTVKILSSREGLFFFISHIVQTELKEREMDSNKGFDFISHIVQTERVENQNGEAIPITLYPT